MQHCQQVMTLAASQSNDIFSHVIQLFFFQN